MEKLLTPDDISEYFGFKDKDNRTAKRRMREMDHMENPLRVTESAVMAWVAEHTVSAADQTPGRKKRKGRFPVLGDGKHIISRIRPK